MGGSLTNIVTTRHTLENYNMMEMGIWMATSATRDAAICQTATMYTSSIQASRRNKRRFAEWNELSSTPDINMETMCSGNLCTRGTNTKHLKRLERHTTHNVTKLLSQKLSSRRQQPSAHGLTPWREDDARTLHWKNTHQHACPHDANKPPIWETHAEKKLPTFSEIHHDEQPITGQPTPHQDTEPRKKPNTSPLTTPHAHRITATLRKTIRRQLVCGMA